MPKSMQASKILYNSLQLQYSFSTLTHLKKITFRKGDDDSDDEDEEVVTASVSAENPEEKEALKALMRCSNDATGMKVIKRPYTPLNNYSEELNR